METLAEINRRKKSLEFNNLMNALIANGMTAEQYNNIINKISIEMKDTPHNFTNPYSFSFLKNVKNVHEGICPLFLDSASRESRDTSRPSLIRPRKHQDSTHQIVCTSKESTTGTW